MCTGAPLGFTVYQIPQPLHHPDAAQYPDRPGRHYQLRPAAGRRRAQLLQGHAGAQLHHVPPHPQQRAARRQPVQPHHPSVSRKHSWWPHAPFEPSVTLCLCHRNPLLHLSGLPGGEHAAVHDSDPHGQRRRNHVLLLYQSDRIPSGDSG